MSEAIDNNEATKIETKEGETKGKRHKALTLEALTEIIGEGRGTRGILANFSDLLDIVKDAETADEANTKAESAALKEWQEKDADGFKAWQTTMDKANLMLEKAKAAVAKANADRMIGIDQYREASEIDTGKLTEEYRAISNSLESFLKGSSVDLGALGWKIPTMPGIEKGTGMPRIGKILISKIGADGKPGTEVEPAYADPKAPKVQDMNLYLGQPNANGKIVALSRSAAQWRSLFKLTDAGIPASGATATTEINGTHYQVRVFPRPKV